MSLFFCALRLDGSAEAQPEFAPHAAAVRRCAGEDLRPVTLGPFLAAAARSGPRPLMARRKHLLAVGNVRLDNRSEVKRWARGPLLESSDLDLVLAALEQRGAECIPELLGDFAFVAWDSRAERLVAARDALGVKPLFYQARGQSIAFCSRLGVFEDGGRYDAEYIADFLVGGDSVPERTIWSDARSLAAGTLLTQRGSIRAVRRFWASEDFLPAPAADERDAVDTFGQLFRQAVSCRMADGERTWAQLSGGLDSSSVVAVASTLAREGLIASPLDGTITVVDTLGGGDETPFSDAVVERFGLRNEQLTDYWAWQDDGFEPPRTDSPHALYPFFARDRRMCDLVREAGGRVILSGLGSDHYLWGDLRYTADFLGRGQVVRAAKHVAAWSIERRQSFWRNFGRSAVRPLLPPALRTRFASEWECLPPWLEPAYARRSALADRLAERIQPHAPLGQRFLRSVASGIERLQSWIERGPFEDGIEMRYPFLYRPLVEFCLRLPIELKVRPGQQKWVLRQAMRGVLPEGVRTRRGKGGIEARVHWSLGQERGRVRELLRDPLLAELGYIRPAELEAAVERARCGEGPSLALLVNTLSLETWLAVRAGRWTTQQHAATAA